MDDTCRLLYLLVEAFHLFFQLDQLELACIRHGVFQLVKIFLHCTNCLLHGLAFFGHKTQTLRGKLLLAVQVIPLSTKGSKRSMELVDNLFASCTHC
jgi:hypothetical protein